jgi:hypothetical protein
MSQLKNPEVNELVPSEFYLGQNYPNPFKEKTIIKYCLAYKTKVLITVFNSKGELIDKLVDEEKDAGTYDVEFNSYVKHSGESQNLAEGEYYYKIKAGNYTSVKKMVLLK